MALEKAACVLSLPMGPYLGDDQAGEVAAALLRAAGIALEGASS